MDELISNIYRLYVREDVLSTYETWVKEYFPNAQEDFVQSMESTEEFNRIEEENDMEENKRWIMDEDEAKICATVFRCPYCGAEFSTSEYTDEDFLKIYKYCPNCGECLCEDYSEMDSSGDSGGIKLTKLVGKHILSGVEIGIGTFKIWGEDEQCNFIKFTLDGVTYTAIENPEDGYRSCMERLTIATYPCKTEIPDTEVVGRMDPDNKDTLITFIDCNTGKDVLCVGTDYSDSYYPSFVYSWFPENLSCNN